MDERIYIIVLNWNGSDDTIECLKSLKKATYQHFQIVIVDNGSEQVDFKYLINWCKDNFSLLVDYHSSVAIEGGEEKSESELADAGSHDKIVIIENGENLGFARGNNIGLKYVLKRKGIFALLLNNDTVLQEDSLETLMNFFKANDRFVAVTPQIRYFEPSDRIWNCGGRITWYGNRKYYYALKHISGVPQSGFRTVTFITGCAILMKPVITGILTERFFFGEEDMEFGFRQKKYKREMACCFDSVIFHKVSSSLKKHQTNILGSVYIHYLSRFIDIRNYSTAGMFPVRVAVNLFYAVPMVIIRYHARLRNTYNMTATLLRELKRVDNIDKEYCLRFLKEDFTYPVRWKY